MSAVESQRSFVAPFFSLSFRLKRQLSMTCLLVDTSGIVRVTP